MYRTSLIFFLAVTSLAIRPASSDDDGFSSFWGDDDFGGGGYWNPFAGNYYYDDADHYKPMSLGQYGRPFRRGGALSHTNLGRYGPPAIPFGAGGDSSQGIDAGGLAALVPGHTKLRRGGDSSQGLSWPNVNRLRTRGDSSEERFSNVGVKLKSGGNLVTPGDDSSEEVSDTVGNKGGYGWGRWTIKFGICSVSCGRGIQQVCKTRVCVLGAPRCPGRSQIYYTLACIKPVCNTPGGIGGSKQHIPWRGNRIDSDSSEEVSPNLNVPGDSSEEITDKTGSHGGIIMALPGSDSSGGTSGVIGGGRSSRTRSTSRHSSNGIHFGGTSNGGSSSGGTSNSGSSSGGTSNGGGPNGGTSTGGGPNGGTSNGGTSNGGSSSGGTSNGGSYIPGGYGWSKWTIQFGVCSVSCGTGIQQVCKTRVCLLGAARCPGRSQIYYTLACITPVCNTPVPVNGGWTAWVEIAGLCSKPCGGGNQLIVRTRTCSNPTPSGGGLNCVGDAKGIRFRTCNVQSCAEKVHGQWSSWAVVSHGTCSVTCGGGHRVVMKKRECNNPPPSNGGTICQGEATSNMTEVCNVQLCSKPIIVHGQWSAWVVSYWPCSVTCGRGEYLVTKRRKCNNPPPANGGHDCNGRSTFGEVKLCSKHACPKPVVVHGQWSLWVVKHGPCSVECGGGRHLVTKTRQCNNPPPSNGGKKCEGEPTLNTMEECNTQACPGRVVHGQWSSWAVVSYGTCSVTCGVGQRLVMKKRQCNNPPPSNGGNNCHGKATSEATGVCNTQTCTKPGVNGQWSAWVVNKWPCSTSCGNGRHLVMKKRQCNNPPPSGGGNKCEGEKTEVIVEACNTRPCPVAVHGQWSAWVSSYGTCSVTCGGGQRVVITRRQCNNPPPSSGGENCQGEATASSMDTCNTHACDTTKVVHGKWSAWVLVSYGTCSATCGGGQRVVMRKRECNNPPPSNGGNNCQGEATSSSTEVCNKDKSCPTVVDGRWSPWSISHGPCSASCGGGRRVVLKKRKCNNPPPSNGGKQCNGDTTSSNMEVCNAHNCAKPVVVHGQWSAWVVDTGPCSATCGGGRRVILHKRKCNNPPPSNGGHHCQGEATSSSMGECNTMACPAPHVVHGQWSSWVESRGSCPVTCGGGQRVVMKKRLCNNPSPSNGGKYCAGDATESRLEVCNSQKCPAAVIDGHWSAWVVSYGPCSASCGKGQREVIRSRTCTNPPPSNGGAMCSGMAVDRTSQPCITSSCPGDPDTGVCVGSKIVRGVGYNPDQSDCSRYIQCAYDDDNVTSGVFYRQCPHGLHWDQDSLTCSQPLIANCPYDKCKGMVLRNYGSSTTCSGYWECENGRSVGRCCPEDLAFGEDGYCVLSTVCRDACTLADTCDKRSVVGEPTMFEQYIAGSGWQVLLCMPGESFDRTVCMCVPNSYNGTECKAELLMTFNTGVTDVSTNANYVENDGVVASNGYGYFNGKSGIRIPRFSNVDYGSTVVMKVRYKGEGLPAKQEAVITNADCGSEGSLYIARLANATYFGERDHTGTLKTVTIQHSNSGWKEAVFELFDRKLTGSVNSVSSFVKSSGTVMETNCAIQIGRGTGFDNFHGYIDELAIYLCKPI